MGINLQPISVIYPWQLFMGSCSMELQCIGLSRGCPPSYVNCSALPHPVCRERKNKEMTGSRMNPTSKLVLPMSEKCRIKRGVCTAYNQIWIRPFSHFCVFGVWFGPFFMQVWRDRYLGLLGPSLPPWWKPESDLLSLFKSLRSALVRMFVETERNMTN
jgi:hypothetical protein